MFGICQAATFLVFIKLNSTSIKIYRTLSKTLTEGYCVMRYFAGHFVWLEEDHYVAQDMLHVLDIMREHKDTKVDILCLGSYLKKYNYKKSAKVSLNNSLSFTL